MTTNHNAKALEEAEAALEAAKTKAYTSGQAKEDAVKIAQDHYDELKKKADDKADKAKA